MASNPAAEDPTAACACCGYTFAERKLVRLGQRPDVAICQDCVEWLPGRRHGLVRAVPVLHTGDLGASMRFWEAASFAVERYDPEFASAYQDGVELHLVAGGPQERDRGAAYVHVRGIDDLHDAWSAAGLPLTEVRDEPWDMREFRVTDPGGNTIRVGQNI